MLRRRCTRSENPPGKVAYGRRRMELIEGTNNEMRPVIQDKENGQIGDGQHKAIVSQELFDEARARRKDESMPFPSPRTDHVNLLTGLLVCPVCERKLVATNTRGKSRKTEAVAKRRMLTAASTARKPSGRSVCSLSNTDKSLLMVRC